MRWFLTNKGLHAYISLTILISLAFTAFCINFTSTTPYADLLPSQQDLMSHPIDSFFKIIEVYKMHSAYVTAETQERRRKKVEDVQKRAEYRKAHGLDKDEGFGGWTARDDNEMMGPGLKGVANGAVARGEEEMVNEKGMYTDFEGRKRPLKKWLGIW